MREERAKSDQVVPKIAGRQHGVVSAAQLGSAGIDKDAVTRRVKACRLHRIHRSVYAVGHTRLTFEGRCMAAVFALGEGAVVSHQSAAALWGMLKPHSGPIHVSVIGDGGRRKRRGIQVHRSHSLVAGVTTRRNGIAVTKPARTLQDLRRTVPQPVYRRAVRRALDLRLIRSDQVSEPDLTRSELERLFLGICRRHRLPRPEVNAAVGPYEVDFHWPDRRVVVETDSWRHHGDRTAFERDRARDAYLQRLGFRVLRFTHRQLIHDRTSVVAALRDLLGERPLTPNL
jgi:very-short-patch-repair endonuclease